MLRLVCLALLFIGVTLAIKATCCNPTLPLVPNAGTAHGVCTSAGHPVTFKCYKCASSGTDTQDGSSIGDLCTNNRQGSGVGVAHPCAVGICLDSGNVIGATAYADPHFTGFDGRKFEFQGEPDKVFALISDHRVQVNARFVSSLHTGETNMGEICVRFCDSTVSVNSTGAFVLSGGSQELSVGRSPDGGLHVRAGLWTMDILVDDHHKKEGHVFLNLQNTRLDYPFFNGMNIHGIIGQTVHSQNSSTFANKCKNPQNEGGCAVEGDWRDYEIADNTLCGVDFKYSLFNPSSCGALTAETKERGIYQETLLEMAAETMISD